MKKLFPLMIFLLIGMPVFCTTGEQESLMPVTTNSKSALIILQSGNEVL